MRGLAPWIALAVLVAGCNGEGDGAESEGPSAATDSTTMRSIEGKVVDAEYVPVADAAVILAEPSLSGKDLSVSRTDASGLFGFQDQPRGSYRMTVTAAGFETATLFIEVRAGQIAQVTVTLNDVPERKPFIQTFQLGGLVSCAASVVIIPTTGSCEGDAAASITVFDVPPESEALVTETVWDAVDESLMQLLVVDNLTSNAPEDNPVVAEAWGPSVLRAEMLAGVAPVPVAEESVFSRNYGPVPRQAFLLNVTSYYAGLLAEEIDGVAHPACAQVYGRCAGAGATPSLRYTVHLSVFRYAAPDDLASYSALDDG